MKKCFMPLVLTALVLSGCNPSRVKGIVEDDLIKHNIEDKYRNFYEIFVYSYCDSNGDGIGDLQGIISKLDYIEDLGYTGIWLTPIFTSSSTHKYNTTNYLEIDPSFGTMSDLESLISECHSRNIKLILDLAINHSSRSNAYFQKAVQAHSISKSGSTLPDTLKGYEDLYSFYDTAEEASNANTERSPQIVPGQDFYYECNFDNDMPEFNMDSEMFWNIAEEIMSFYLNKGIDGFRLDAVKYYYYNSASKTQAALSRLKEIANSIKEDNYFVAECWASSGIISGYYTNSSIDSYFWFPASVGSHSFITSSTNLDGAYKDSYLRGYSEMLVASGDKIPAPFLSNHDMSRVGTGNEGLTKFAYGALSMLTGSTFTYYGDEIGISASVSNSDANARTHMNWSDTNENETINPGYGQATYKYASVKEQLEDEGSILNYYKKANALRNCIPELQRGVLSSTFSDEEESYITMVKTYNGSSITIVMNFSQTKSIEFNYSQLRFANSLLALRDTKINIKGDTCEIPALGIAIFR